MRQYARNIYNTADMLTLKMHQFYSHRPKSYLKFKGGAKLICLTTETRSRLNTVTLFFITLEKSNVHRF